MASSPDPSPSPSPGTSPTPWATATVRDEFGRGARDVLPIMVGVVPFGLIVGVSGVGAGLTTADVLASSLLVFAGASQLAMIDLLGQGAPWLVAVLTAAVINVRMLMYSASMAPWFASVPLGQRAGAAYFLTDQSFALSVTHYAQGETTPRARLAYYLGTAVPLWLNWQLVTVVGALAGAAVPDEVPLAATIPLVFLALLVPAVTDRPTLAAALVGGGVAVLAVPLPANLGLMVGALAGISVGVVLDRRRGVAP